MAAHVVVRKYERAHPADVVGGGLLHSDGYKLVVVIDDDAHQHAALGRRECEVPVGLIYFALCKVAKQLTEVAVEVSVHLGNGRRETLIVVHQRPVEVRLGLGRPVGPLATVVPSAMAERGGTVSGDDGNIDVFLRLAGDGTRGRVQIIISERSGSPLL